MSDTRKFKQGRPITTMGTLSHCLDRGEWVYWAHKPLHYGWIGSMPYRTLRIAVENSLLRRAIPNESVTKGARSK